MSALTRYHQKFAAEVIDLGKCKTEEEAIEFAVGNDAPEYAKQAVREQFAAIKASKAAKAAIINRYAPIFGVTPKELVEKVRPLYGKEVRRQWFSSQGKFEQFAQMLEEMYATESF